MTKSVGDPRWGRLAAPTKLAIRWAWAVAAARAGTTVPSVGIVDGEALLSGILLADLRGSPARELFQHFDIPLGAVLNQDGTLPVSPDALLAAIEHVPDGELPPLASDIVPMMDLVLSGKPTEPDGLISLRELFGAWLTHLGPTMVRVREQLAARGASPDDVNGTYRELMTGRTSYGEFLRQRFPYRPLRVEQATYLQDQPQPRAPRPEDQIPDLVGIRAEVDAFAYLIASNRLKPPMAVGLFGNWGSGKSYFLRSMQQRIDSVAKEVKAAREKAPDTEPPFHSNIVQIEFNAWQYIGGDLLASLLEHLFRNLRRTGHDGEGLLARRQRFWISKVDGAKTEFEKAEGERKRLQEKRDVAATQVAERREELVTAQRELEQRRKEQMLAEVRQQIKNEAAKAGIGIVGERAEELAAELTRARTALHGAGAVLAPLRTGGWRYLAAVVLLLVLPPVVAVAVQAIDVAPLAAVATTVASLLATVAAYVRLATTFVTNATKRVAAAQAKLAEEETKRREQVAEAQSQLDKAQDQLDAVEGKERELAEQVEELTAELAATTPSRVLSDFITDRMDSDDYRRHLGVPALVRRDLEELSDLVVAQHNIPAEHAIDRIVLYIDDLDRCPTELVIKVLEAVHLLLAFPLFVVVVAVDSRWLASSLRDHYTQLSGTDAVPEDYLEKIFQVPFWVRPLGAEVRQRMLRGLLAPNLGGDVIDQAGEETGPTEVPPTDLAEFRDVVDSFSATDRRDAAWLAATRLTITADEMLAVEDAADLVGATPRAVKRFVNIYLLAKSMGVSRGWTVPRDGQLAVLLAIATGLPALADVLLPLLAKGGEGFRKLRAAMPTPTPDDPPKLATGLDVLNGWMDGHPDREALDMSGLADWIEIASRFRFSARP